MDSDNALGNFATAGTNLSVGGIDHAKLPRGHALHSLGGVDALGGGVETGEAATTR